MLTTPEVAVTSIQNLMTTPEASGSLRKRLIDPLTHNSHLIMDGSRRPTNHQSSHPPGDFSSRGRDQGRGRGRWRGRGRGGSNSELNVRELGLQPVPGTHQVQIGTPVSIVLKLDQSTGRQVQGFVGELLTRGNHPRGIKVRLRDGRVGRVQRMSTEEEAKSGSEGLSGLGEDGQGMLRRNGEPIGGGTTSAATGSMKYSDFRNDGYEAPPPAELNLEDYLVVKPKGKKGKGKKKTDETAVELVVEASSAAMENLSDDFSALTIETTNTTTSTCPVCGTFEGDESAVAYHVNAHFG